MRKRRRRRAWQPPKGTPPLDQRELPMWPTLRVSYVSQPMPKGRASPGLWTTLLRQSLERQAAPPVVPALPRAERRRQKALAERQGDAGGWLV